MSTVCISTIENLLAFDSPRSYTGWTVSLWHYESLYHPHPAGILFFKISLVRFLLMFRRVKSFPSSTGLESHLQKSLWLLMFHNFKFFPSSGNVSWVRIISKSFRSRFSSKNFFPKSFWSRFIKSTFCHILQASILCFINANLFRISQVSISIIKSLSDHIW
jgi:hypothetical protein